MLEANPGNRITTAGLARQVGVSEAALYRHFPSKARMFEGGLRVPTVIRGPGVMAGAQCDVPIAQWDFLPTIHDLSGSTKPLPADLDGGSLADIAKIDQSAYRHLDTYDELARLNASMIFRAMEFE